MGVYSEWLRDNDLTGMAEQTHGEFASYLLQNLGEMGRCVCASVGVVTVCRKTKNYSSNLAV